MFSLKCQRRRSWHWCLSSWDRGSWSSKRTEQRHGQEEERREERWLWVSVCFSAFLFLFFYINPLNHYDYFQQQAKSDLFSSNVPQICYLRGGVNNRKKGSESDIVNSDLGRFHVWYWNPICIQYVSDAWRYSLNSCDFYISPTRNQGRELLKWPNSMPFLQRAWRHHVTLCSFVHTYQLRACSIQTIVRYRPRRRHNGNSLTKTPIGFEQ